MLPTATAQIQTINESLLIDLGRTGYEERFGSAPKATPSVKDEAATPEEINFLKTVSYLRDHPACEYQDNNLSLVKGTADIHEGVKEGQLEIILDKTQQVDSEEVGTVRLESQGPAFCGIQKGMLPLKDAYVLLVVGTPSRETVRGYPIHNGYAFAVVGIGSCFQSSYVNPELLRYLQETVSEGELHSSALQEPKLKSVF